VKIAWWGPRPKTWRSRRRELCREPPVVPAEDAVDAVPLLVGECGPGVQPQQHPAKEVLSDDGGHGGVGGSNSGVGAGWWRLCSSVDRVCCDWLMSPPPFFGNHSFVGRFRFGRRPPARPCGRVGRCVCYCVSCTRREGASTSCARRRRPSLARRLEKFGRAAAAAESTQADVHLTPAKDSVLVLRAGHNYSQAFTKADSIGSVRGGWVRPSQASQPGRC
jgi:hypothetical protein